MHATLVKAGGHLIQRTEECEARHIHTLLHNNYRAALRKEGTHLVKRENLLEFDKWK